MSHKLILMRHGQSEFNDANIFCGWLDVHLTAKGKSQAKKAADLMSDFKLIPNHIFTSKLTRTCQTAKIIMEELDREWIDISKTWRLNERHYGSLQGRKKNEVLEEMGEEKYMFIRRAYNGVPPLIEEDKSIDDRYRDVMGELPKGESLEMVVERLSKYYFDDIITKLRQDKTVLVICHGSTVRALLKIIKNLSDEEIKKVNIPNGIPLCCTIGDDGKLIGEEYYLDPETAKQKADEVAKEGFSKF